MFFSELIKSIRPSDIVLEIGPGSSPHPRSNIFLEKRFLDVETAYAQRGYADSKADETKIVYYDGGKFPFKDKEFDYVICSHVIEHIPKNEISLFISELQRVAYRGYLEFPNVFYELINYQEPHIWLMNYRDNKIYFLDKNLFNSNYIHRSYREMFYGKDNYLRESFLRYKDFYFCGFEWEENIQFEEVFTFNELINEYDYIKAKNYFANFSKPDINPRIGSNSFLVKRRLKIILNSFIQLARKIKKKFKDNIYTSKNYYIHKSAQLEKTDLILIKSNAEIKDYVIIRTYENPVVIGEFTQINPFTVIYGGSGVFIGNNVMIAPHCMIAAGNHDFKQLDKPMRFADSLSDGPIFIEDNVWIGANCTITDGVRIGKDSVIAANSVVNQDVAPYDIVGGVPAKVIGNRKKLA
jgi:acetyltransferase-like isoleucine patch superfamily enzyme/ubiquinone/menaquinone biosynthesis C-methylase UbiE